MGAHWLWDDHIKPRQEGGDVTWTAHYFDPRLNASAITRPCSTKEEALRLACDLMRRQCRVEFIAGPESVKIHAVEIAKCARPIRLVSDVHS
jgi:hypothetical protein